MKKKAFPQNIFIALMLLLAGFGYSQTTSVQFQVNMNYQVTLGNFNPATQTVDVAGTFNNWGSPTTVLSDTDGDGIYTTTLTLTVGTTYQFKTRINAQWNGTEEFSGGGPNRSYTAVENGVLSYWYNDQLPPDLLDVNISASALIIQPGQSIQFTDASAGTPVSWQWSFPGGTPATSTDQNPQVSYAAEGNYSITLTVTNAGGESATETFTDYIRVDAMQTHWWNDRVFYEIFVRSFKDSNNDGKGDIQGLISKLDYLNDGNPNTTTDLGVTGIWLMPIMPSPSYHGYDITNYLGIEEDYGTAADFTELINACHARGIKVIIDMVMNHTSSQHPWFVASASSTTNDKRDWYIWNDTDPGTAGPFDTYPWNLLNGDYYYGAFYSGMPDLNYYNPEVHTEMENIASYWLTDMNVDGFRLDAVRYLYESPGVVEDDPQTVAYWQQYRQYYKSIKPDAFAVGEAWDITSVAKQYTNNNGLDYCFEFELADSIINGLNSTNASDLISQMNEVITSYPFQQWGTFLTNHDGDRTMSRLGSSTDKAKAAATMLLTLPGIPYIYYGEEIGMTGVKPDENIRTPMQWSNTSGGGFTNANPWYAINGDLPTKNVTLQQATTGSLWQHYRNLIALRNNEVALRQGTYLPVASNNTGIFAYIRQYQNQNILVVVNLNSSTVTDATVTLVNGNITPGNYTMTELLGGSSLDVTVTADGGFAGLNPGSIAAKGYKVYKLTGILGTETLNKNSVVLYPNPAVTSFRVNVAAATIEIYNTAGQKVKTKNNVAEGEAVDIASLAKGLYVVKVTGTNGRKQTIKLLKQ
ncbi:alpha-amylase family glycosyl hydrolase [Flavobacterium sp. RHBU_3]|uniref:alpha-amylase family glycosyl hydrolase n=1 Tax=Flavobacterium sp. RHBU_3 TaxID=3391184 RepID=UPI003984C843